MDYKFHFTVKNGKLIPERKNLFRAKLASFENKRGYLLLKEENKGITENQVNFFEGVILKHCQESNVFQGWTHKEIRRFLLSTLIGESRTLIAGNEKIIITTYKEPSEMSRKELASFIESVIAYLELEHGITIDDPENYKKGKYIINKGK